MPRPCKLTFDILTLKVMFESHDVGYLCANFSLPRPLFIDLGPMYATDRRQTDAKLPYRYYWYLVILYFNYLQEMYFVCCILPVIAEVIEKSIWITLKKCNLYFVIEIHFKSNWSNSAFCTYENIHTEIPVCCLMYRAAQRSATFHFQSLYHAPASKKHDIYSCHKCWPILILFFQHLTYKYMYNEIVTKDFTTPQTRRYTTVWN